MEYWPVDTNLSISSGQQEAGLRGWKKPDDGAALQCQVACCLRHQSEKEPRSRFLTAVLAVILLRRRSSVRNDTLFVVDNWWAARFIGKAYVRGASNHQCSAPPGIAVRSWGRRGWSDRVWYGLLSVSAHFLCALTVPSLSRVGVVWTVNSVVGESAGCYVESRFSVRVLRRPN